MRDDVAGPPDGSELVEGLGLVPEPVAWIRAPYGTLELNPLYRVTGPQSLEWAVACFTEYQLRAAVDAECKRCSVLTDDMLRYAMAALGTGSPAEAARFRAFWLHAMTALDTRA
jgi:hypothetical protein